MKSIKALFIFTLIWSSVVYFNLKKSTLGSVKNPIKVWVLADKEKAVYFRAKELVKGLREETGFTYEWKVVFSEQEANESLSLSKIDVLLHLENSELKAKKPREVSKEAKASEADGSSLRNPASFQKQGFKKSVKAVQFRKALPKRINYSILKGLRK
ncbi:MAG: hypothetical protein VXW15_02155 [Bdellovibrionota bacterium]|nr:hypothetical protein [Bdellovibrionota bacterium]